MEVDVDSTLQQIGLSIRRFRVKRMKGVPSSINWVHYDIINDEITIVDVSKLMTLLRGGRSKFINNISLIIVNYSNMYFNPSKS